MECIQRVRRMRKDDRKSAEDGLGAALLRNVMFLDSDGGAR